MVQGPQYLSATLSNTGCIELYKTSTHTTCLRANLVVLLTRVCGLVLKGIPGTWPIPLVVSHSDGQRKTCERLLKLYKVGNTHQSWSHKIHSSGISSHPTKMQKVLSTLNPKPTHLRPKIVPVRCISQSVAEVPNHQSDVGIFFFKVPDGEACNAPAHQSIGQAGKSCRFSRHGYIPYRASLEEF